jgi:hypothetical protein
MEEMYQVDKLISQKAFAGGRQFLVKFLGFDDQDDCRWKRGSDQF